MTGGMNVLFRVWRRGYTTDDAYGGSAETETQIGDYYGRFDEGGPSKMLIEQGIEVDRVGTVLLRVGQGCGQSDKALAESDQLEIVGPNNHPFINKRFVVHSVQHMATHPAQRRNLIRATIKRTDWSRTEAEMGY